VSENPSNPWADSSEDGYYVSITDMLVGLLFLFIILLMYFALQLKLATQDLVTAEESRTELLQKVAGYMQEHNVRAEADLTAGVLRLPDQILFDKGRDAPKAEGVTALQVLADGLVENLPCYAFQKVSSPPADCTSNHHLEAIFIEGHTDSDPITPNARLRDNWDLSAARAANTFRILTGYRPGLMDFLSEPASEPGALPIFSVAGYADQRPVAEGDSEAAKNRNRRIDVRFVMAGPEIE